MSENSVVPGQALSSSSVDDGSSGYDASASSDNQRACVKKQRNANMRAGKAKDRHVKIVTSSDVESSDNAETTESAGDETTDGSNKSLPKAKSRSKNKKGNATRSMPSADNESSALTEDISTDADTSAKSSQASTKDPNWSVSEDCRLQSMKEAGETWVFITNALCKSKTDARARWKVLQSQSSASEPTTEAENNNTTTEEETGDAVTKTDAEENETHEVEDDYEDEDEYEDEEYYEDEGYYEDDEDEYDDEEEYDSNVKDSTSIDDNNKWYKGPRNDKVAIENKWAKARANAKTSDQGDSVVSGQESSSGNSVSSSCLGYGDPEKEKQRNYLQDHIYKEMYPAEIHPKPDAYLGKRDCDILASLDSKYKKSRWLEMQANFYNVTGRMVPLEAIRARCERAEAEEEEERSEARKLQKRLDKVENWISKQSHKDSEE
ncbi:hypothetical protein ACHAP5_001904 [Fusarium lateritium]